MSVATHPHPRHGSLAAPEVKKGEGSRFDDQSLAHDIGVALLIVGVLGFDIQRVLGEGEGPGLWPGARCPECEGRLAAWGSYRRWVRGPRNTTRIRLRRAICTVCAKTHALFPSFMVPGRRDLAGAVFCALLMAAAGKGQRPIAHAGGVPQSTVRGWLRRLRVLAQPLRSEFQALGLELGGVHSRAPPPEDRLAALAEAITHTHQAAIKRLGPDGQLPVSSFAIAASQGRLLSNMNRPLSG